ncbi:hypothetical protein ACWCQS_32345 [Streptomyces sp. NPDC002076]
MQLASSGRLDLDPFITDHTPLTDAPEAAIRLEIEIRDPIRLILAP